MNTPLAVHSVQGMFVGLLVLRILGDNVLASRWKDLPDVFVDLQRSRPDGPG